MNKSSKPELARAINEQAHMLAAGMFAEIRMSLRELARAHMQDGKSIDAIIQAIRTEGLRNLKGGR